MSDKSLGYLVFSLGLIGAILYLFWLFAPANTIDPLFYVTWITPPIRWALILPIVIAVLGILFIAMWIGYTMAVTPSPMLIEVPESETDEQKKGEVK